MFLWGLWGAFLEIFFAEALKVYPVFVKPHKKALKAIFELYFVKIKNIIFQQHLNIKN
jgi:hypothetical protein